MALTKDDIREAAEADIEKFIALVFPQQVLGQVHREVLRWMTRQDKLSHQLLLLPRDHGKSRLAAFYVAWRITKDPTIRVLYISSTSNLAVKQLKFIKDILTSKVYRSYWPTMVNEKENAREKWTETEIAVDHPKRREEVVRDPTIFTAGLTTVITGMHCDLAVFDDVVSPDNAYTEDGRAGVEAQYSQLASIEGGVAEQLAVGTRYHPLDLYGQMQSIEVETEWDDDGTVLDTVPLYEVFEREVEDRGDGTGQFLWPVTLRKDGKPFGFDAKILARKRAQYLDKGQFRAQYYNDPNAAEDSPIDSSLFQYFDAQQVRRHNGKWHYGSRRLNVFAAVDFAYKTTLGADFTCVVVVGVDGDRNYYVLDIDRFKTDKISEYFNHVLHAYEKWGFNKIRMETTAAQSVIVKDIKENYIRPYGLALSVDENTPSRSKGTKEERIEAALNPRYENLQMWHYRGGNTQLLEEELQQRNPSHDDIKDCLAACIEICVAPAVESVTRQTTPTQYHPRFGGVL